jgi:hypothetical protein
LPPLLLALELLPDVDVPVEALVLDVGAEVDPPLELLLLLLLLPQPAATAAMARLAATAPTPRRLNSHDWLNTGCFSLSVWCGPSGRQTPHPEE